MIIAAGLLLLTCLEWVVSLRVCAVTKLPEDHCKGFYAGKSCSIHFAMVCN